MCTPKIKYVIHLRSTGQFVHLKQSTVGPWSSVVAQRWRSPAVAPGEGAQVAPGQTPTHRGHHEMHVVSSGRMGVR